MKRSQATRSRRLHNLLAVPIAAMLVAACGAAATPVPTAAPTAAPTTAATAAPSPTADPWAAIVAKAKTQPSADALFTEVPGWIETQQNLLKSTTGTTMNLLARGANGVLETRLTAEVQANAILTDVYEDVSRAFFVEHLDWFVDLSTTGMPNWAKYPEAGKWKNVCADVKWSISGVTYNTQLVTGADIPKTWQDLVNIKWKDKVVLSDPTPGGYYTQWSLMMREKFGVDFLKSIAALNVTLSASSVSAAQQVGSGAKALSYLSQVDSGADVAKQGAPIKFLVIPNPYLGSKACVGVLKKGPHPEAGLVALNFLMSPESQSAPCNTGILNVSPVRAPGCYEAPADFAPPQVNDKGIYPGMDDQALINDTLVQMGLKK